MAFVSSRSRQDFERAQEGKFRGCRGGASLSFAALAAGWPAAAFAATLGQAPEDDVSIWRVVAALFLCMVLAVGGAFALRVRNGNGRPISFPFLRAKVDRRLKLVETLRIGSHVDLSIVSFDGSELLIASSAHGAEVLTRSKTVASPDATP